MGRCWRLLWPLGGLAALGRFLRIGLIAAAAGGAGVIAGWYAITGRLWAISAVVSVNELTGIAVVALLIGLLCTWQARAHVTVIGMLLAAFSTSWFLSGAPRHQAALRASWPIGLSTVLAVLLLARALSDRALRRCGLRWPGSH